VNGPEIHLAGGVWPVANPGSLPGRGQTPWELAADCLDRSAAVFASHGVTREQMFEHDGPAAAIVAACGGGSREAVALSLWTMARNGQSVLSMASREGAPSPATMAEAVAGVFANIGMLRLILDSMEPKGIADSAVDGRRSRTQREAAARNAGAAARRDDWRQEAREAWSKDPEARLSPVAKAIAKRHSTGSHEIDPSSVRRAIREVMPETSLSFREGRAGGLSGPTAG
jgi:hypothetical protein